MLNVEQNFVWTGRTDHEDGEAGSRWHQKISKDKGANGLALIGLASDLGVMANKGRPGAKAGPDAIRQALANMAWHLPVAAVDGGNVVANNDLAEAQASYAAAVSELLEHNQFVIGLGGGHEIAWGSYNGLLSSLKDADKKIGIINFDAHFDLRKPSPATSSGTPFYQIAQHCKNTHRDFRYACLGVAETANTQALFNFAAENDVAYLLDDQCEVDATQRLLIPFLQDIDELYLTICLDAFPASAAPGVSAPSALGISPEYVIAMIRWLSAQQRELNFHWRLADIAEMNPQFDLDSRTAKLAARLAYELGKAKFSKNI